jgi:hypothetical protein
MVQVEEKGETRIAAVVVGSTGDMICAPEGDCERISFPLNLHANVQGDASATAKQGGAATEEMPCIAKSQGCAVLADAAVAPSRRVKQELELHSSRQRSSNITNSTHDCPQGKRAAPCHRGRECN